MINIHKNMITNMNMNIIVNMNMIINKNKKQTQTQKHKNKHKHKHKHMHITLNLCKEKCVDDACEWNLTRDDPRPRVNIQQFNAYHTSLHYDTICPVRIQMCSVHHAEDKMGSDKLSWEQTLSVLDVWTRPTRLECVGSNDTNEATGTRGTSWYHRSVISKKSTLTQRRTRCTETHSATCRLKNTTALQRCRMTWLCELLVGLPCV